MQTYQIICFIFTVTLCAQCNGRSIRTKRGLPAQWAINRYRRDLWKAYRKLEIIYAQILSDEGTTYVPTSVGNGESTSTGDQAQSIIAGVLGNDFPIVFDQPQDSERRSRTAESIRRSIIGGRGFRTRTTGSIQVPASISVSSDNTNYQSAYGGVNKPIGNQGLVIKVVTDAGRIGEDSRRTSTKSANEVIHLCGQINRVLSKKSLRLKCEAFLGEDEG